MRYNSRARYKNNEISHKLYTHFGKSMNMARIKFYGKPELQILVSLCNPEKALETYKERWQTETAFRALKSSGFNIEQTHLSDIERIGKLLSIVIVAFTWCYCIGIYRNEHIKKIRMLKHKRRAVSLFKYGLDLVSDYLLKSYSNSKIDRFIFLSCT